jgi:hypothetical protein
VDADAVTRVEVGNRPQLGTLEAFDDTIHDKGNVPGRGPGRGSPW